MKYWRLPHPTPSHPSPETASTCQTVVNSDTHSCLPFIQLFEAFTLSAPVPLYLRTILVKEMTHRYRSSTERVRPWFHVHEWTIQTATYLIHKQFECLFCEPNRDTNSIIAQIIVCFAWYDVLLAYAESTNFVVTYKATCYLRSSCLLVKLDDYH